MEVIKITDVPQHLTNLEVLYVLSDRIESRKQQQEARVVFLTQKQQQQQQQQQAHSSLERKSVPISNVPNTKNQNKKLQHRDFIEEKVARYIQSTVAHHTNVYQQMDIMTRTINVDEDDTDTNCQRHCRRTFMSQKIPQLVTKLKRNKTHVYSTSSSIPPTTAAAAVETTTTKSPCIKKSLHLFTEMEILQILNLLPTERVELHLILQNCEERFQEDLLDLLLHEIQEL